MQYFIILPKDKEKDTLNEANLIGEESFGNFWPGSGLNVLMTIVTQKPELVEHITIKTDQNKVLSIDEFLRKVNKLKIKSK
jgi:hypothetical protein